MNTSRLRPVSCLRLAVFLFNRPPIVFVAAGVILLATTLMLNSQTASPMAVEPSPPPLPVVPASPVAPVAPPAAPADDKTLGIDFSKLGFIPAKDPVDSKTGQPHYNDQLPAAIKAYDGRKVRIRGYLMPVKMEGNEVREFLIMAGQMSCCYGTPPRFWEFIVARMKTDAAPNLMDRPLTFEGTLRVGDVYDNSYWTQLYTMECTAVIE